MKFEPAESESDFSALRPGDCFILAFSGATHDIFLMTSDPAISINMRTGGFFHLDELEKEYRLFKKLNCILKYSY